MSFILTWPLASASPVSDFGPFEPRSLLGYSKSGEALMSGDSPGDSTLARAAIARHGGEAENEFAVRSASFFIDGKNYAAALKVLFAARVAVPNDTTGFLLARCFEKMGSINLALGANYAAHDSGGALWPMVLFQRASLLYAIGMDQRAEETARSAIATHRKSAGADSCRRLLSRHEHNALVPVLSMRSYAAYGTRNYHNESTSPSVLPGIVSPADTTVINGNGFVKPALSWTVFKSGTFQCTIDPAFELQFPYDIPRREQYGFGAGINFSDILGRSSLKYGLAAKRALYNRTGLLDTYMAYGFFIKALRGQRSLMLLASGAAQRSDIRLLNGNCVNVVAEERSALTIGKYVAFHPGITALWTGFRDVDNRFVPLMVAVSGASENGNVHKATYYQDATFTDTIPVNGFKANSEEVLLPYAHTVQAFRAGSYSASEYCSFGLTNTVEIKMCASLSLNIQTSYSASWYPRSFQWDNASAVPSGSDALGLVFYNRDDGYYYYTESLASGVFHQYQRREKVRIDRNFACGMGASCAVRRLGTFIMQGTVSVNRSSIPNSAFFDFNYVELVPRVDWIVQW